MNAARTGKSSSGHGNLLHSGASMKRASKQGFAALLISLLLIADSASPAQNPKTPYPNMASLDQYLSSDRNAEIALARSAAPDSISRDAEILALTPHGYEVAVKGTNGFVCMVQRPWVMDIDEPEFWNPKLRAPICVNAAAAPTFVGLIVRKTEMILGGQSKEQMAESIKASLNKKEFPPPAPGAMSYMMSKQGWLNDHDGHWHPHVMFFTPTTDASKWGADLDGSPILALHDRIDRMTIFLVPVAKWSDGTPDTEALH